MMSFDRFVPARARAGLRIAAGRRGWLAILLLAAFWAAGAQKAAAQTVAAADAGGFRLSAGGAASAYNLGYGNVKVAGFSVFVDADTMRHFGFEGEIRFLPFHI